MQSFSADADAGGNGSPAEKEAVRPVDGRAPTAADEVVIGRGVVTEGAAIVSVAAGCGLDGAPGDFAAIAGGCNNYTGGGTLLGNANCGGNTGESILGGYTNQADAQDATVSGGAFNNAQTGCEAIPSTPSDIC